MEHPAAFRKELRNRSERYLLAVPSNTTLRDLEIPSPECCGTGRPPQKSTRPIATTKYPEEPKTIQPTPTPKLTT